MLTRRFLVGGLLAAPAIVRTPKLLMPVRRVVLPAPIIPRIALFAGVQTATPEDADPADLLCSVSLEGFAVDGGSGRGSAVVTRAGTVRSYRLYGPDGQCVVQGPAADLNIMTPHLHSAMNVTLLDVTLVASNA